MKTLRHGGRHAAHRRAAYERELPIGDQIDAIAKGFAAMRDAGAKLPADTIAWLATIAAIKARHPKDA